jgi:excisionase family DNA binding protein
MKKKHRPTQIVSFEDAPDWLLASQVMRYLGVSKMTVYHLMEQGVIKAILVNRPNALRVSYRFSKEDVEKIRGKQLYFAGGKMRAYEK